MPGVARRPRLPFGSVSVPAARFAVAPLRTSATVTLRDFGLPLTKNLATNATSALSLARMRRPCTVRVRTLAGVGLEVRATVGYSFPRLHLSRIRFVRYGHRIGVWATPYNQGEVKDRLRNLNLRWTPKPIRISATDIDKQ